MKKSILLLIALALVCGTEAQVVQIQGGTAISTMNGKNEAARVGYSLFAGINYLDRPHFNLSSHVGVIRKGGRLLYEERGEEIDANQMRLLETTTLDYVSINTTFDFKIPKLPGENYTLFISAGPRVDYLFNSRVVFAILPEERIVNWNQLSAGLLIGFGVRYDISRLQLGIRGDYYANFLPPTKGRDVHTFNVHLTVGYKLFP